MSLKYFTPGPTESYPKLTQFLEEAQRDQIFSLSHRSPFFQDFFHEGAKNLKSLLGVPEDFHVFFIGSATECMERLIENCVREKSLHFVNGAFSRRMYQCALELQKSPILREAAIGKGFSKEEIELNEPVDLICLSHCETSGCTLQPLEDLYALKRAHPESLLAIDIVTTAPYALLDYTLVDSVFFSIQKGFGLPAGMGVLLVNDRCIERSQALEQEGYMVGTYHKFSNLLHYETHHYTPETPNILGIYLLGKVVKDMLPTIETIRSETQKKARLLYTFLEESTLLRPFVEDPRFRAETVIGVHTPWGSEKLIEHCREQGFLIGSGYGEDKSKLARIANFPVQSSEDTQKLIEVLKNFQIQI